MNGFAFAQLDRNMHSVWNIAGLISDRSKGQLIWWYTLSAEFSILWEGMSQKIIQQTWGHFDCNLCVARNFKQCNCWSNCSGSLSGNQIALFTGMKCGCYQDYLSASDTKFWRHGDNELSLVATFRNVWSKNHTNLSLTQMLQSFDLCQGNWQGNSQYITFLIRSTLAQIYKPPIK